MKSGQVEVQGLQVNYKRIKDDKGRGLYLAYRYCKGGKCGGSLRRNTELDVE